MSDVGGGESPSTPTSSTTTSSTTTTTQVLSYRLPPTKEEIRSRPKPKFRLGWVSLLPLALFLVVEIVWHGPLLKYEASPPDQMVPFMIGKVIGVVGISLLVAWLVWWVARRPRIVAPAVFGTLVFLFTVSEYFSAGATRRKVANSILSAEVAQWKSTAAAVDANVNGLRHIDLTDLNDAARLNQRIAELDQTIATVRQTIAAGDAIPAGLAKKLADLGMPQRDREREVARFMTNIKWTTDRAQLDHTAKMFEGARAMAAFVRAHPGDWAPGSSGTLADLKWETLDEATQYLKLRSEFAAALQALMADTRSGGAPATTLPAEKNPS